MTTCRHCHMQIERDLVGGSRIWIHRRTRQMACYESMTAYAEPEEEPT